MLEFSKILTEDLNVGVDTAQVTNPGGGTLTGRQVGIHSIAVGQLAATATWEPGTVEAGLSASTTVTVSGAATTDFAMAAHPEMGANDITISAHVQAANTVRVVISNPTASDVVVASGTLRVLVFKSA